MVGIRNKLFLFIILFQFIIVLSNFDTSDEKLNYYKSICQSEAEWLWSQQLPNGAFAFYYHNSGEVSVNPYFSETVAIALINYDNSNDSKKKIEKYFDWHFSHLNNKTYDINNLEGTIYDYKYKLKNGIIIEESTSKKYDSTDSYAALFLKALGDYANNFGINKTKDYILNYSESINQIVNAMLTTMVYDYSYAKPNYKIIYLMDNCEVYSGLKSAEFLYTNIIKTENDILLSVKNKIDYFDKNFDRDWWKIDHYASILNKDRTEYTHINFTYSQFYPSATSQLFPFNFELIDPFSNEHSKIVYQKIGEYWKWEEMDYFKRNESDFYWTNFALFASVFKDQQKLDKYLIEYQKIVDNGRKYPLYSSESGKILLAVNKMINYIIDERSNQVNVIDNIKEENKFIYIFIILLLIAILIGISVFLYIRRKHRKNLNLDSLLINK